MSPLSHVCVYGCVCASVDIDNERQKWIFKLSCPFFRTDNALLVCLFVCLASWLFRDACAYVTADIVMFVNYLTAPSFPHPISVLFLGASSEASSSFWLHKYITFRFVQTDTLLPVETNCLPNDENWFQPRFWLSIFVSHSSQTPAKGQIKPTHCVPGTPQ